MGNGNKRSNNVRFICTYENYEKERSGIKRNHVIKYGRLAYSKWVRLCSFIAGNAKCSITIQKGYTSKTFTRDITDVTKFEKRVIISW